MHTDSVYDTNRVNEEQFNLVKLIKCGSIRLKLSIDVFLVPLIIYKVTDLLHINNTYLHISLIVANVQLFVIHNVLMCIISNILLLFYCRSLELPKFTLLCVILYIIFSTIGYGKLKTSEICIISQIITTLFYLDGRVGYDNFTLVLAHRLTLNITVIAIAFSIFLFTFKNIRTVFLISQVLWYTTLDWLLSTSNGIRPIEWILLEIFNNLSIIIIWGIISIVFILLMLFKVQFKENRYMISSLRKDVHFLLSSIIMVSLYLDKMQMLILALDFVLLLFLFMEMLRHTKIPLVVEKLQYLRILYNERDSDDLLFIHIFIVIGLMIPLLTSVVIGGDGVFGKWILGCIGVYTIGLADSMASILGLIILSPILPLSKTKTVCGSLTFFMVLFGSLSISTYTNSCFNVVNVLIISFIGTLYEGYSDSADNLTVPLVSTLALLFLGNK